MRVMQDRVHEILEEELASLTSEVEQGRRDKKLSDLDERGIAQELVRQQYSGRYPFELLQNANDAAALAEHQEIEDPRAGFVVFAATANALLVANGGKGFGSDEVRAICGLGRTSKDPTKAIGYKGLGFKSVGEISDEPQIFSNPMSFQFSARRARDAVGSIAGPLADSQRLPVSAFPFPLDLEDAEEDGSLVEELLHDGFVTVIRLPLRGGVTREKLLDDLKATLDPRTLLFLESTESLEIRGTERNFLAIRDKDEQATHDEVLLDVDGVQRAWRVYTRSVAVEDRGLVQALGDAWAEVDTVRVAAAVPLDGEWAPSSETPFPLHVYFPTEEHVGLPFIVQGDFALELDRRHVSRAPEALPFNRWLAEQLVDLVASDVAPDLAERYPAGPEPVWGLSPVDLPTGWFGEHLREAYAESMGVSRFLPVLDGRPRLPNEAIMLPASLPPAPEHPWLNLDMDRLILPSVSLRDHADQFLRRTLEVTELDTEQLLDQLVESPDGVGRFYEWVVSWAERVGRGFASLIADVPCVRTEVGDWLAPSQPGLFFPRERDAPELSADLGVHIADVPEVDGLRDLLAEAGVSEFRWRDIIQELVLPPLTSSRAYEESRSRAHQVLRTYLATEKGEQDLLARIGQVLLPARTAEGTSETLRAAASLYFGRDWTESESLERLYGPFGEHDFLAIPPPEDEGVLEEDASYYRQLGVADHPRVDRAEAGPNRRYRTNRLYRHPHKQELPQLFEGWQESVGYREAARCPSGPGAHPESQQLRVSYSLDRIDKLLDRGDPTQLGLLFVELAAGWSEIYQPAFQVEFYCVATAHTGRRSRQAPSLIAHALTTKEWIPTKLGESIVLQRPDQVWRLAPHVPARVAALLPVLADELDTPGSTALATRLGIVDAARASVVQIVRALQRLADAHEDAESELRQAIEEAAPWLMRTLNDSLERSPEDVEDSDVPLLAKHGEERRFVTRPYVTEDEALAEMWSDALHVLVADRGLSALTTRLQLERIEDTVKVAARPSGMLDESSEVLQRHLDEAGPYLAALAVDAAPSRIDTIFPRLSRISVVACSQLELAFEFRGEERIRTDPRVYLAERVEDVGRRRAFGTAFFELGNDPDPDPDPDWYSFGDELASFLRVPSQRDAFALVLAGDEVARRRFLRSRHLDESDLRDAAERLRTDAEIDLDVQRLWSGGVGIDLASGSQQSSAADDDTRTEDEHSGESETPSQGPDDGTGSEEAPNGSEDPDAGSPIEEQSEYTLPELDLNGITGEDADPSVAGGFQPESGTGSGGGGGGGGTDWDRLARKSRIHGRRGEEAAYHWERRRLQELGLDQNAVSWVSAEREMSNHDLLSLDAKGHRIYIEVKSTPEEDPSHPFEISDAQLRLAMQRRTQFYVYRVLRVDKARPHIVRFRDPIGLVLDGRGGLKVATGRMTLGPNAGGAD